jgi:hypothetical protein
MAEKKGQTKSKYSNNKKKQEASSSSSKTKAKKRASSNNNNLLGWKSVVLGVVLAYLVGFVHYYYYYYYSTPTDNIVVTTTVNHPPQPRGEAPDPITKKWIDRICRDDDDDDDSNNNNCHESLVPVARTFEAIHDIPPAERLMVIPRSWQLYDLDVLRHPVVQMFFNARHPTSDDHRILDAGAYVAVYFLWHQHQRQQQKDTQPKDYYDYYTETENPLLVEYFLDVWPTSFESHPIFWSDEQRHQRLPKVSPVYAWSQAFSDMVESEYRAFRNLVDDGDDDDDVLSFFSSNVITLQHYKSMRLAVMTRCLSHYPLPPDDDLENKELLDTILATTGLDLRNERLAFMPLAELSNHHLNAPAIWTFDSTTTSTSNTTTSNTTTTTNDFVFLSTAPIKAGQELFVSYGKFSLSWMYAYYGFVIDDGSGPISASVAVFHNALDESIRRKVGYYNNDHDNNNGGTGNGNGNGTDANPQDDNGVVTTTLRTAMSKYLQYDDGYAECLVEGKSNPQDVLFKDLKLRHLMRTANIRKRWSFVLPARNDAVVPPLSTTTTQEEEDNGDDDHNNENPPPPQYVDQQEMRSELLFTCRLMTLHSDDYEGRAVEVLQEALDDNNDNASEIILEPPFQNKESEYRTLHCIRRLTGLAKAEYQVSNTEAMLEKVARLNREEPYGQEWALAHVQLSELQVLDQLEQSATDFLRNFEKLDRTSDPKFVVRYEPCQDG